MCSCTFYASCCVFFFQAEDGIRDLTVTGVQTCALPILAGLLLGPVSVLLSSGISSKPRQLNAQAVAPAPSGANAAWTLKVKGDIRWQQVTPMGALLVSTDAALAAVDIERGQVMWEKPELGGLPRSEEHTSELQSQSNLVCRLLLEKKKKTHTRLPRLRSFVSS